MKEPTKANHFSRSHKIELAPTLEQASLLSRTAGATRFAYNWALSEWKKQYSQFKSGLRNERPSVFAIVHLWNSTRPDWTRDISSVPTKKAVLNVGKAYTNWWRGLVSPPCFHKKTWGKGSFYIDNAHGHIKGCYLHIPKVGYVRMKESPRFAGKILSYTISTFAGKWYTSVSYELPYDARPHCSHRESIVGVDVGIGNCVAVASDGTRLMKPSQLRRMEVRKRVLQRCLSRKKKGSNNRRKCTLRYQRLCLKMACTFNDAIHKFTTTLAKNHGSVCVEDLHISDMRTKGKPRSLGHLFASSQMRQILTQLNYKFQHVIVAPKYFPSSKMCSLCGNIKEDLLLSDRTYRCTHCGAVIDRDYNAACNLMNAGMVSPGVPVECAIA